MARQAASAVQAPARRSGRNSEQLANPARARSNSRRGGILLEPLPAMLPTTETELKLTHAHEPTEEEIRVRAYQIYLNRGRQPGHEVDDWVQAEQELRPRKSA